MKISITHNKKRISLLDLLINCILARSTLQIPNGHTTSNPGWINFKLNLRRWVQNQISTNFQVVSTYFFSLLFCWSKNPRSFHILFWCNLVCRNIHIFSMFFFWCNFDCWKIHVVSTYFFDVISLVEKLTLLPLTFFDVISMAKKSTLFARAFSTKFRWAKIRRRF